MTNTTHTPATLSVFSAPGDGDTINLADRVWTFKHEPRGWGLFDTSAGGKWWANPHPSIVGVPSMMALISMIVRA